MGDYTHTGLQLVTRHVPDYTVEDAGDGTKVTRELPGFLDIGTEIEACSCRSCAARPPDCSLTSIGSSGRRVLRRLSRQLLRLRPRRPLLRLTLRPRRLRRRGSRERDARGTRPTRRGG